jgi:branched-chain amino acid transport system substrate-binding protein
MAHMNFLQPAAFHKLQRTTDGAMLLQRLALLTAIFVVLWQPIHATHAEDTIRIGSILPLSGPYAVLGEGSRRGQLLALEEINAGGGINGKRFEVIFEDSGSEPARAVAAFNALAQRVTNPIIYASLTGVVQAIKPLTERRGFLLFIESTLPGIVNGSQLALRNFLDFGVVYGDLRKQLEQQGVKKVIVLRSEEEWAESALESFKNGGKGEMQILAHEAVSKGSTDMRAQLLRLKAHSSAADAFVLLLAGTAQATAVVQSSQIGLNLPKVTSYLCSQPGILTSVGSAYDGHRSIEGKRDVTSEAYRSFVARYETAYKLKNPEFNSLAAYDSLMIIAKALRASMKDAKDVREYMLRERQFPGVLGVTVFSDSGDVLRGGQLETVSHGKCMPVG